MTPDERSTERIRGWLTDTADELGDPMRGMDDILAQVSTSQQHRRRRLWPWQTTASAARPIAGGRPATSGRTWGAAGLLLAVVSAGLVTAAVLVQQTEPRMIVVAQDGSGDVTTIGEGVAMAVDGDTVAVRPGTYVERVMVDRAITIVGDGARDAIVVRAPEDDATFPDGSPASVAFTFERDSPRLSGLTIAGSAHGRAILVEEGAAPVISHVTIDVDGAVTDESVAIWWSAATGGVLRESTVSGKIVVTGAGAAPRIEANTLPRTCVHVMQEGSADPPRPVIRENDMGGCTYGYLIDAKGGDLTIEGNTLELDHARALNLGGVMRATIRDNRIHGNAAGMSIVNPRGPVVIQGNTIWSNDLGIFVFNGDGDVRIEGNTIRDNALGISLAMTTDTAISGNTFCGNGQDVRVSPAGQPVPSLDGNTHCELPVASARP